MAMPSGDELAQGAAGERREDHEEDEPATIGA
jgi:hypothetical protein